MLKKNLLEGLKEMSKNTENELTKYVIDDILDRAGEDEEEAESYIKDVITYGCISGMVGSLIYYTDTEKFFKKYCVEILDLCNRYKEETGEAVSFELTTNNLAWFGYEETMQDIACELGIDF